MLLVPHLALVARCRLDLFVGVEGVARPLVVIVDQHDFVLDGGPLRLVTLLVQSALVHLVVVVYYLQQWPINRVGG